MSGSARFEIGSTVVCSDGDCGEVLRVVIDPTTNVITHVAVGPRHDHGQGRLVPIEMVASQDGGIVLRCSRSEFDGLLPALDAELMPEVGQRYINQQSQVGRLAYYDIVEPGALAIPFAVPNQPLARTFDRLPPGEVDVRRGEQVEATDGAIGHIRGLVFDPETDHVTHILLDEGHLWAKKQVAIPISAVERIEHLLRVKLTKQQVGDLPSVDVDVPG